MSPISTDDLDRIFHSLDRNNNGLVSVDDLHRLLSTIGITTTRDELESLVGRGASLDYIDFIFFYEAMVKANCKIADHDDINYNEDLFKAFSVFDLDGDGFISCDELERVLTRMGLWDRRSGYDCKDMIGAYDKNSDGVLDFDEFKDMMFVSRGGGDGLRV